MMSISFELKLKIIIIIDCHVYEFLGENTFRPYNGSDSAWNIVPNTRR